MLLKMPEYLLRDCKTIGPYSLLTLYLFYLTVNLTHSPIHDEASCFPFVTLQAVIFTHTIIWEGFPAGSVIKNLPAMLETPVQSLCLKDPLEKEMATHSSILALEVPWTEESGRLQSMGSQRVTHLATKQQMEVSGVWEGWTSVQRLTLPNWQSVGKNFYRQRDGVACRNSTVSSDSHLQIGHGWSDQSHLDCFKDN